MSLVVSIFAHVVCLSLVDHVLERIVDARVGWRRLRGRRDDLRQLLLADIFLGTDLKGETKQNFFVCL